MRVTRTFQGYKGVAEYGCVCGQCGKALKRKVVVEHTVNPFNKNEAGEVKTVAEVSRDAQAEAQRQAAAKEGETTTCKDCEDAPNRALLLAMAAEPERAFPQPERFYGSPMQVLEDRGHVFRIHVSCECGSDCCSGWKRSTAFKLTPTGIKRAGKLQAQAA